MHSRRGKILLCLMAGLLLVLLLFSEWRERTVFRQHAGETFVCFGDSIWDTRRDDTGIGALLKQKMGIEVINLGISGSSAAMRNIDGADAWNAKSFVNLVQAITDSEGREALAEEQDRIGIFDVDYENVSCFMIAYGINDYYSAVELENEDPYDVYTYAGALRTGISQLQEAYPAAKIIVLSPTFTLHYSYGQIVADSNTYDYGAGVGSLYADMAKKVAEECDVTFVDMYNAIKINKYNGARVLSDGTHFTTKGLWMYANALADKLTKVFLTEK